MSFPTNTTIAARRGSHILFIEFHYKLGNYIGRVIGFTPLSWGFILRFVVFLFLISHAIKWW